MKLPIFGGDTILNVLDDLKVTVTFNRFDGDGLIKTVFPSANTDSNGNLYAVIDTASAGTGSIVKSVTADSTKLGLIVYGLTFTLIFTLIYIARRIR